MLDRERVEAILMRRFPTATPGQIAAATNALMALAEEPWPDGLAGEPLARFLSERSTSAYDDPLLRTAASRNTSARR